MELNLAPQFKSSASRYRISLPYEDEISGLLSSKTLQNLAAEAADSKQNVYARFIEIISNRLALCLHELHEPVSVAQDSIWDFGRGLTTALEFECSETSFNIIRDNLGKIYGDLELSESMSKAGASWNNLKIDKLDPQGWGLM